jgi:hypothetical protein
VSTETFRPVGLEVLGSWCTTPDPSDLPPGLSPDCPDVEFIPGGFRTRPGVLAAFTAIAGNPKVNGLKSYLTLGLTQRLLVFTSAGELHRGAPGGVLTLVEGNMVQGSYLKSTTQNGSEWCAFSNGVNGAMAPRHYNDTNLDRVSQEGPGGGVAAVDSAAAGTIAAGVHKVVCWFETRSEFWTKSSVPVSWTAAGAKKVTVTIPTGPPNIIRRYLGFTGAGGARYYHMADRMIIDDNTTTSFDVDFTDAALLSSLNVDDLVANEVLPYAGAVLNYANRLVWIGCEKIMQGWRNLGFEGGIDPVSAAPFGWTAVGTGQGSGGGAIAPYGECFRIFGNSTATDRGMITQPAVTDAWGGAKLIKRNKVYTVRCRVRRSSLAPAGSTLRINLEGTGVSTGGLFVATGSMSTSVFQEFEGDLTDGVALTAIPADLVLRVWVAAAASLTVAHSIYIDEIRIIEGPDKVEGSVARISNVDDLETYDGRTGLLVVARNNGQRLTALFQLRRYLYLVKERSLYVTADDGVNEPSNWSIDEASASVGTPSAHGVDTAEGWAVLMDRTGLYFFDGGTPRKISGEIQPDWDRINWAGAGDKVWVRIDQAKRRILCGVPLDAATEPSHIYALHYNGDGTISESWGALLIDPMRSPEQGRKWSKWSLAMNSAGLVESSTGPRIFLGNQAGNGLVSELRSGQRTDSTATTGAGGTAIQSYWRSGFVGKTGTMSLFGYLTAFAFGNGTLRLYAFLPGDSGGAQDLGTWPLDPAGPRDLEQPINISAERVSFKVGTTGVGEYLTVTKLQPFVAPDPWAYVQGK